MDNMEASLSRRAIRLLTLGRGREGLEWMRYNPLFNSCCWLLSDAWDYGFEAAPARAKNLTRAEKNSRLLPSQYRGAVEQEYFEQLGRRPDLDNPRRFTEKLCWLKLWEASPRKTLLADKYLGKLEIAKMVGEKYLPKVLGVWDSFEDIDWDSLPERFVLKTTHASNQNLLVTDRSSLDLEQARHNFNDWLGRDFSDEHMELHYRGIVPRIIAEELLVPDNGKGLRVLQFYCFDGEVAMIKCVFDSKSGHQRYALHGIDWSRSCVGVTGEPLVGPISRPEKLELMLELSRELSRGFPHVRVDFFDCGGRVYVSELTFTTASGLTQYTPDSFDLTLGSLIKLPGKKLPYPERRSGAGRR